MIDLCRLTYNPVEAVHCFLFFEFFERWGGGGGGVVRYPTQNLLYQIINCTNIKRFLNALKSTECFLDGTS